MAKNDKNNTKNANEGIRYGPRTGGDYRRSHDAFTGYNDCFYRDRFSDGSISGQRSRGTVGFHCLSAGSCCGDTCCGMGRRTFWRTALLDDGSCDLPDRFFFVRCFSGAAGIGGMPCAAGLWSGRAYNAAYFAAGGDCPQQGDHGGGRHYVHSHASSFAGTDLGPVLGGIVLSAASWHWLFLINIPVGILAILFSARWLGADADGARTEKKRRFDLPGFLFVAGAISALLLGFTAVSQRDSLTAPSVAVPLILGIVLLAVFVALPSARDPERAIVDISLFRHRSVTAASAAMFFAGGTLYAAQFLFPLFWQRTIGATALEAALMLLPQGVGALLTRTAAGRLTDAYGGRGCCDRTDSLSGGNGERGRLHHVLPGAGGRFGGGRCRFPDISPVKMNQKTSSPHRPLCGIMSAERSLYHRAYRFLRPPQKAGRIRRRQHVCEADML